MNWRTDPDKKRQLILEILLKLEVNIRFVFFPVVDSLFCIFLLRKIYSEVSTQYSYRNSFVGHLGSSSLSKFRSYLATSKFNSGGNTLDRSSHIFTQITEVFSTPTLLQRIWGFRGTKLRSRRRKGEGPGVGHSPRRLQQNPGVATT